jgi:hypothetical protein
LLDEKSIRRMFRAHEDAIDEGISADSNEYFRFVENRLGLNKPVPRREAVEADDGVVSEAAKPVQRQVPPPSAPPSRGQSRAGTTTLTAAEREMADMMNIPYEKYAKNRDDLKREGKLN